MIFERVNIYIYICGTLLGTCIQHDIDMMNCEDPLSITLLYIYIYNICMYVYMEIWGKVVDFK